MDGMMHGQGCYTWQDQVSFEVNSYILTTHLVEPDEYFILIDQSLKQSRYRNDLLSEVQYHLYV